MTGAKLSLMDYGRSCMADCKTSYPIRTLARYLLLKEMADVLPKGLSK